MKELLAPVASAARAAGAAIMDWYRRGNVPARAKADASPVTPADLASHDALARALPLIRPGVQVLSEETAGDAAATVAALATLPTCWLVDPLDGTRDFLARTGEFAVNIALLEAGVPILGCIYSPVRGVAWIGARGVGAFRQDQSGGPLVPVRGRAADPKALVCLVSRMHRSGEDARLARLPGVSVRPVGSALKYALIAAGEADVSWRETPTSLWDTAAAQCLLEVAGGALLRLDGQPLSYTSGTLINPPFIALGDRTFDWRRLIATEVPKP